MPYASETRPLVRFFTCGRCALRFLAAAILKKCGDSGDKSQELRIDAGLQRLKVRGQCGDKTGAKRGQYWYVKKNYSFTYIQPLQTFVFAPCLALCCALRPAFVGGLTDLGPGVLCLVPATARPRPAIDSPGNGREKGSPMAPHLAALLSGLMAC